MKKTIWVINQFAGSADSGWGERHFFFAKYWLEMGYEVTIISGSYNHMFKNLPIAPGQFNFEEIEGRTFCWIKTPKYKANSVLRFWSFFIFAIKVLFVPIEKAGKPDVIIVSSMPIFSILSGFLLKKRYNSFKLLFEIRDIWPLTLIELGDYSRFHPAVIFIGWFEKFGYKYSDKIVSLLPNAKSHFEQVIPGSSNKFEYIPNGLDFNSIKPEPLPIEIISKIPSNKFIIGYTGTIGLANALEYLVQAARILHSREEFFFIIVGEGSLKMELRELSKDLNNILFLDKIKKNQVMTILSYFHICFVGRNDSPLYKHGVSANKYFDYMLAGKPILDSNNLIKDPVELSGGGIIVRPDSAEAIVYGINQFYSMSDDERNEMGRKGKKYVENFHNIKALSNDYLRIFSNE
jgi:glycosyltransferase involved in cell wall biosynthesis